MAGIVPVILNKGRYAPDCVGADAPAKENELKNYLMFALLICATASMAFGQFGVVVDPAKVDVACPDEECHVAPVFMGEGGFVGELADGFDMANFVVTCGNTTASGSAAGDGGGVVRQLFSMANGLACHSEGGSIQIHGLADGGWYWINDDMNSAVSPLIAKDALMGDEVMPTDPGGVTLMAGDYGTYVKSGSRVGILPHFVPTAPVEIPPEVEPEAPTVCMPALLPNRSAYYANDKDCMLGDGGTTIVMTAMTADGRSSEVTSVHRNPGGDPIEIHLDLWGNGSGHISSDSPHIGWNLPVPRGYRQPEPFKLPRHAATAAGAYGYHLSLASAGNLGTGLADAGISLKPGGLEPIPGKVTNAPGGDNLPGTPEREDGFYMDSTTGENAGKPQCTQNVRTFTDSADNSTMYLQFVAASGSDPVEIEVDSEGAPASDLSRSELADWVRDTHNVRAANKPIKTVRVVDSDDAEMVYNLPAVVCKTQTGASPGDRYVGATIEVSPDTDYCNSNNNRMATVTVLAYGARGENNTIPKIAQYPAGSGWRTNLNASTVLQVHCAQ